MLHRLMTKQKDIRLFEAHLDSTRTPSARFVRYTLESFLGDLKALHNPPTNPLGFLFHQASPHNLLVFCNIQATTINSIRTHPLGLQSNVVAVGLSIRIAGEEPNYASSSRWENWHDGISAARHPGARDRIRRVEKALGFRLSSGWSGIAMSSLNSMAASDSDQDPLIRILAEMADSALRWEAELSSESIESVVRLTEEPSVIYLSSTDAIPQFPPEGDTNGPS